MRKTIFTLALSLLTLGTAAQTTQVPAFPGAEGHGRHVTGGRGGKIVHVTNLNDSGTGSLRYAVSGSARKIVVFDVAGVIALQSNLTIGDNTTICGQTAPEPGITVRYYTVQPGANNIIRFMRFRRGQERDINDGADACWQREKTGIILDHCSFSWSIDEVASFYDNNNFTMQWCTIAESLCNPGHSKGEHGYGGIWGGKLASFHHNMIAHVKNRGPRFNGARYNKSVYLSNKEYQTYKWANSVEAENVDFRNCVMYDAQGTCYGGPGGGQVNMVNNYYKAGPRGGGNQERITTISVGTKGNSTSEDMFDMTSRYYISGNTTEKTDGTVTRNRDWDGITYDSGVFNYNGEKYSADKNNFYVSVPHVDINGTSCVRIKMDEEAPAGEVTTHSASKAFDKVLEYAGASLYRDDVDARYMTEAREGTATYTGSVTGTQGLIDLVSDVNGYTHENFPTAQRPEGYDTDQDGMPDEWEKAHGLDPNDAADALAYSLDERGMYQNIELYCNSIVESIMRNGNEDAQTAVNEYYPVIGQGQVTPPAEKITVLYAFPDDASAENLITFDDGATLQITGNASKNLFGASNITVNGVEYKSIKLSNGAENTFTCPEGKTAVGVTFYSYVNIDNENRTPYWASVDEQTFTAETATILKSYKDTENPDIVTFPVNAKRAFTFKNAGEQLCFLMAVTYGSATGIAEINTDEKRGSLATYNVCGQRVSDSARGLVIRGGKKFIKR